METLRFLMITTHFPPNHLGGDAVFVDYLSRELVSAGHEVDVFTAPGAYSTIRGAPAKKCLTGAESERVNEHRFEPRFPGVAVLDSLVLGRSRHAEADLGALVKRIRPDVVHWHNTKGFIGQPSPPSGPVSVYTAHDYYSVCPRSNLLRPDFSICNGPYNCFSCHLRWGKPPPLWRLGPRRPLVFDEAMRVLSPSDFMARKLQDHGIRIHCVVNNFVPRPSGFRDGDIEERDTIVYAGMLEPHKGVATLLRAFYESRDIHKFRLVIIGTGTSSKSLADLVDKLNLGDRVELTGFVSRQKLNEIRGVAAFQVVPSEWPENAPLTAIEALASGIPIITSDQGGLPEIARTDDGALVFKAGDVASLSDCLIQAWSRMGALNETRRAAIRSYEERYLPEIHIRRYMDALRV